MTTAAELKDERALNRLGNMYYMGRGVERDFAKALDFYQKAVENGSVNAKTSLGTMYFLGHGVTLIKTRLTLF
ncbi:TPR repeat protein [Elusimicrobium simillimum]|uniref:tetratricopeptide repeat protein n=1 Tax=Elusimicrobium simillimum TaxID=3143438 RepID=UPI003C6F8519